MVSVSQTVTVGLVRGQNQEEHKSDNNKENMLEPCEEGNTVEQYQYGRTHYKSLNVENTWYYCGTALLARHSRTL